MWMLLCKCFFTGFGLMLGVETALGICLAFGDVTKGAKRDERT